MRIVKMLFGWDAADRSATKCATLVEVSFFDEFPVPPEPEQTPFQRRPWMGPPPGWVGGWVGWHLVLARTADLYAALGEVFCFPTGVEFSVSLRLRPDAIDEPQRRRGPPVWML